MLTVGQVAEHLEQLAPLHLAEEWDNVGLLIGDRKAKVRQVMTCLTLSLDVLQEALTEKADLVITHHPIPFRPLKQITTGTRTGRILLDLIAARIAVYSPHTSWDSAARGINQRLAEGIGLADIRPLLPAKTCAPGEDLGAGRVGACKRPVALKTFASRVKKLLGIDGLFRVGNGTTKLQRVAVACGSGGSFLEAARSAGCDCLITGEASFHTCLEAADTGMALLLPGHYASERFSLDALADELSEQFPEAHVWASRQESDPLTWS